MFTQKPRQDDALFRYDYGARYYDPSLARWTTPDPKGEIYYSLSIYHYGGNNPITNIDINGQWFWENKNIRKARKYARKTNGTFHKWVGQNGKTWARVTSYSNENNEIKLVSKVFAGTKYNDHSFLWNTLESIDAPEGHADPFNTGNITKKDIQVGTSIVGTIISAGVTLGAETLIESVIGFINTLNAMDGITTNDDGSIVSSQIKNEKTKKNVKKAKATISSVSAGITLMNIFINPINNIQQTLPAISDIYSAINNMSLEKNQNEEKEENEK